MGKLIDRIFNMTLCKHMPALSGNAKVGKWYEVETPGAICADGSKWHGFLKVGKENKVVVLLFGGGVSMDEHTAARGYSAVQEDGAYSDTFSKGMYAMANCTRLFGLGSNNKKNPFRDWSVIVIPYANGDFHAGCGEVEYTALNGEKRILYHHGYTNFHLMMKEALKQIDADSMDSVLVTGGSAGGFGSAILADTAFDYFPKAKNLAVAVDAGLMVSNKWKEVALHRWHSPKKICDRLVSDDIMVDSLIALYKKRGKSVRIMFACAVRDAALTTVQAYLDGHDRKPLKEDGEVFQRILKNSVDRMQEEIPNVGIYLFEKISDEKTALMQHTILFVPMAFQKFSGGVNPVQWVHDCMFGTVRNCGLELLEKTY